MGQINALHGKTIVNLGDSIFGNFRPPKDISTFLARQTGATVYNGGFGGSRMSKNDNYRDPLSMYRLADSIATGDWHLQDETMSKLDQWCILKYFPEVVELLKSVDFRKVDIVTIAHGTNDFTAGVPVQDPQNPMGTHCFSGALCHSIEALQKAFPHLEIVICTPTWRFWMDENGDITDTAETRVIAGQKLLDFVQASQGIARKYGLFCIDNYRHCGIGFENRQVCFSGKDGTHPAQPGRELIAGHMAKALSSFLKEKT